MIPAVNTPAPDFNGIDQNGNKVSLSDFKGSKLILYFYPKDNTTGCSAQACNLRDNLDRLSEDGYKVVGVSVDDAVSHQKFIQKYSLNFPLIADTDHSIVNTYGVWAEKSMYGRKYMGTNRVTFVIDADGIITKVIEKVKTGDHAAQIA